MMCRIRPGCAAYVGRTDRSPYSIFKMTLLRNILGSRMKYVARIVWRMCVVLQDAMSAHSGAIRTKSNAEEQQTDQQNWVIYFVFDPNDV